MAAAASSSSSSAGDAIVFPRVVVFDLDACCWSPEMYELWGGGAPFTYDSGSNTCTDRAGTLCSLFSAIPAAWTAVVDLPDSRLAIASRCDEPKWADEILRKFKISNGMTMMEAVDPDLVEIYKSSKKKHLSKIREKSGVGFSEMLFLYRNHHHHHRGHPHTAAAAAAAAATITTPPQPPPPTPPSPSDDDPNNIRDGKAGPGRVGQVG